MHKISTALISNYPIELKKKFQIKLHQTLERKFHFIEEPRQCWVEILKDLPIFFCSTCSPSMFGLPDEAIYLVLDTDMLHS